VLQHCPSNCHSHVVQSFAGVAGSSFTAPDHEHPAYLELRLTAKDSAGLTDMRPVRLDPRTVTLTVNTNPTGLTAVLNGASGIAPFGRTVILGSRNSISAPSPQTRGRKSWTFRSWSDGGAQTHDVVANGSATYTATFKH